MRHDTGNVVHGGCRPSVSAVGRLLSAERAIHQPIGLGGHVVGVSARSGVNQPGGDGSREHDVGCAAVNSQRGLGGAAAVAWITNVPPSTSAGASVLIGRGALPAGKVRPRRASAVAGSASAALAASVIVSVRTWFRGGASLFLLTHARLVGAGRFCQQLRHIRCSHHRLYGGGYLGRYLALAVQPAPCSDRGKPQRGAPKAPALPQRISQH